MQGRRLEPFPQAGWKPLLAGAAAEEGIAIAREIGVELAALPSGGDLSLSGGRAGVALLFGYLSRATGGSESRDWSDRAVAEMTGTIEGLASAPLSAELHGGFTGIAWAAEHLAAVLDGGEEEVEEDAGDLNAGVDEALLAYLEETPWERSYDLVSGLVGIGVYLRERLPRPAAQRGLGLILGHLLELSEERDGGLTWRTKPQFTEPSTAPESGPDGLCNLGLAHGVPGVVAFLSALCRAPELEIRARPLLEGAVDWLLAREQPAACRSAFPYWYSPGQRAANSRSAWCYGDPGVALALLQAAAALADPELRTRAVAVALRAAGRSPDEAGVIEAGLCHGSTGLGLMFHRLYLMSGEERLAEAGRRAIETSVGFRFPGRGVAGYRYKNVFDGKTEWRDEPGLLIGAAGVALGLLALSTPEPPAWDRCLLLSA